MPKVAIVLFVKDEAEEILWWISWHLAQGVDTLLIYDDRSTDGTWEIINAAAKVLDVRCFRTPETLMFQHRQGLTYTKALDDHREEFDWIGFLDGDEYLDLQDAPSIQVFLDRYSDADGVTIDWCCYGSNGHVVRPGANVLEHFQRHSTEDFLENKYGKAFVRPKRTSSVYINPHNYTTEGRFVTTDGLDIKWVEPLRQWTEARPNWQHALIRHFVIRSVEHYVEKFKRRGDLRTSGMKMSFFNHYDRNDLVEHIADDKMQRTYMFAQIIQHQVARDVLQVCGGDWPGLTMPATIPSFQAYSVKTTWNSTVSINSCNGTLCHAYPTDLQDSLIEPAMAFTIGEEPYLYLGSMHLDKAVHCFRDDRVSRIMSYEMVAKPDGIALRCPNTRKFVSFGEIHHGDGTKPVRAEADREWGNAWETVRLQPLTHDQVSSQLRVRLDMLYRRNIPEVLGIGDANDVHADMLLARVSCLPQQDILRWRINHGIQEIPWLQSNQRISF